MYTGKQFDRTRVVGSFVSKRGYLRRQWCARRLPTSSYKRSAMGSRRAETLHRLATIYAALEVPSVARTRTRTMRTCHRCPRSRTSSGRPVVRGLCRKGGATTHGRTLNRPPLFSRTKMPIAKSSARRWMSGPETDDAASSVLFVS